MLNAETDRVKDVSSYWLPRKTVMEEEYPDSRWTFDTPGLINENQVNQAFFLKKDASVVRLLCSVL